MQVDCNILVGIAWEPQASETGTQSTKQSLAHKLR